MRSTLLVSVLAFFTTFSLSLADTADEASQHIDINTTDNILNQDGLSVTCKSCTATGDVSISAGCGVLDCDGPDTKFAALPFDYDTPWIVGLLENFKVHIELDFDITPSSDTTELHIPLLGANGVTIDNPAKKIFELGVNFNPILHGWINSSAPVKFSYGFEFDIPSDSAVYVPPTDLTNTSAVGFSKATITPLNYTSPDPNDSFNFSISFRPQFSIVASVLEGIADLVDLDTGVNATVFADVPQLEISVSQVHNVGRDCLPAPADASADEVFGNLTFVQPTLSFDLGLLATGMDHDVEDPLGDAKVLATSCLDYNEDEKKLDKVPETSGAARGSEWGLGVVAGALAAFVVGVI